MPQNRPMVPPPAARGKSPRALEWRYILFDGVARRSNVLDILAPRTLSGGRLVVLGAAPDFCYGPLRPLREVRDEGQQFSFWPHGCGGTAERRFRAACTVHNYL